MNLELRFAWSVLKALGATMFHDRVTFFIYSFGLVPVIGVLLGVAVPVFLGAGAHGAGNVKAPAGVINHAAVAQGGVIPLDGSSAPCFLLKAESIIYASFLRNISR